MRSFPTYSSNPSGENYGLYCKCQLLKYKPWHGTINNAWDDLDSIPEVWISQYHLFLQTDIAQQSIPHFSQDLHLAEQRLAQEGDDSDDESFQQSPEHQEEWMFICQLNPRPPDSHITIDWAASTKDLPSDIVRESPSWISSQGRNNSTNMWQRQLPPIDIATLNSKQRLAYDIIQHHHSELTIGNNPDPLYMIILGTAGTGKSYLISAIAALLTNTCVLTGTTGMASFHICGGTLHSALHLPIHRSNQSDLQGASLQQIQMNFQSKHYLIIDEMSMIGQKMFAWVDKRLRQASGKLDIPLGGFSVILIGDFGQLPPVMDKPLFAPTSTNQLSIHGHQIY